MYLGAALLKQLAGRVAAPVAGAAAGVAANAVRSVANGLDFARLLTQAQAGGVHGNEPVTVAPQARLELNPEQLQRLSKAADQAEAAGFTQALVLLDGQPLLLDVQSRQVLGVIDPAGRAASAVDGVVAAPSAQPAGNAAAPSGVVPLPGRPTANASLAKLLQGLANGQQAA